MNIKFNNFVRRQVENSPFSHWNISEEEVLSRTTANFPQAKKGYRDGVVLVPVESEGFFSSVVRLNPNDKLEGEFKARREGEEPRKTLHAKGNKLPAKKVDVILYRKDVLAENKENSTDADWEVVSINASPEEGDMPISPETLIANFFQLDGGTATHMSDNEFVLALKESVLYWKDKAMVG